VRLRWEKNLRLLVEAARGLHRASANQPPCKLVFVGDGPSKQSIERMCADYGIDAVFCGHLRGERLAAAFASADVFAFPSFTETFGQVRTW
jgi:glycosyltransferase involved in cell wall biosynthesis